MLQEDYDAFDSKVELNKLPYEANEGRKNIQRQKTVMKKLETIEKNFESAKDLNEPEEMEKKHNLISYNNIWRNSWDVFIIIIAMYSGFFIPFVLAFDHMAPVVS